jgi:hypothetical protein
MEANSDECETFRDDLALLALGTLSGRERADVIDHVERCPECAAELEGLSVAADALLLLAPEETPPLGFDQRTVMAMDQGRHRRWSAPSRIAAIAAMVATLGLGVGLGTLVSRPSGNTSGFVSAALTSPSGANGSVVMSWGSSPWMLMTLNDVPATGRITCTITLENGTREDVGHFRVSGGYGAWAVRLPAPSSDVKSVEVEDTAGVVLASAPLHA